MTTTTENLEAVISNMMGYDIYMLAVEHIARMIEYPSYDDWGTVENELHRAKHIRTYMEKKFPSLLDKEIQKRCDDILQRAESFYTKRCEMEREMLHRRLEFGKVTLDDAKRE